MLLLLLLLCCVSPALGSKFNKNKLFPEYGINFRYISEIKNGLDRVLVVTSVPLPHFKDIHISPLKFHNCSMDMDLDSAIPVPDRTNKVDSYTKVHINKPYLVAGDDYYIQLKMTELVMCKSICYTCYCEELFVVKHKSCHSCASAIFYDLGPEEVVLKCQFDYIYNATTPPTVLDSGRSLLLANFHEPRSLKCNSKNRGLPKPAPEHVYAVVDRSFLCDCQLDLEHHATILRQLSSCTDNRTAHF